MGYCSRFILNPNPPPPQAQQTAMGAAVQGAAPVWHPLAVKAFVGVSGAYDLPALAEHLHRRGLYRNLLHTIMTVDGRVALKEMSPVHAIRMFGAGAPWGPGCMNISSLHLAVCGPGGGVGFRKQQHSQAKLVAEVLGVGVPVAAAPCSVIFDTRHVREVQFFGCYYFGRCCGYLTLVVSMPLALTQVMPLQAQNFT